MMPFCFDGKQWTYSMYTLKDINVSEIAKKYGGGGHKKAAGFQSDKLLITMEAK
jgi:nanoRNase/pAp phosphatase (c-di-AMP/oligoRNAs hydrolase)